MKLLTCYIVAVYLFVLIFECRVCLYRKMSGYTTCKVAELRQLCNDRGIAVFAFTSIVSIQLYCIVSHNAGESIIRTLSTIQVLLLQLISMTSQILPLQM